MRHPLKRIPIVSSSNNGSGPNTARLAAVRSRHLSVSEQRAARQEEEPEPGKRALLRKYRSMEVHASARGGSASSIRQDDAGGGDDGGAGSSAIQDSARRVGDQQSRHEGDGGQAASTTTTATAGANATQGAGRNGGGRDRAGRRGGGGDRCEAVPTDEDRQDDEFHMHSVRPKPKGEGPRYARLLEDEDQAEARSSNGRESHALEIEGGEEDEDGLSAGEVARGRKCCRPSPATEGGQRCPVWLQGSCKDHLVGLRKVARDNIALSCFVVFIPLGFCGHFLNWGNTVSFCLNFLAIVPQAWLLGKATEDLAAYSGWWVAWQQRQHNSQWVPWLQ
eukprot:GHVU01066259.1.p1 GENE.GHVU01066259.1~~GHVU01066259.1.p1  ORF type:complete len:335 (+),score=42.11 GHVU01066259.1:541-1545(+)